MLDGLEAVELRLSEVLENNETFRFDSEYFKKEYLSIENIIRQNQHTTIEKILGKKNVFSGPFGSTLKSESYQKSGVPFIRISNIQDIFIERDNLVYISENESIRLDSTTLNIDDIVLSKIGTIGKLSLITPNLKKVNISENNIGLRLNNLKIAEKRFLLFFLLGKFGQKQILKKSSGNVQLKFNVKDIDTLLVPDFHLFDLKYFEKIYDEIINKQQQSKMLYQEAENILLKELDLLDFKPSTDNIAIKTFSESFAESGRLDSEYYQPKYNDILNKIKQTKYNTLANIVNIKKSIEPGSNAYQNKGIPFIRVSNLSKYGVSSPDIYLSNDMFDSKTLNILQPKKNTILLSKDGTVGIAYNLKKDENFITSGALLHLVIGDDYKDKIFNEYLTLVLNNLAVQMQSQRDAGGSIIKHWKPSEIKKVLIPIIDTTTQAKIENKIQQSFALKEKSKQLLDIAKKAVEVAIEQGENQAIKLINEQV